MTITYLIEFEFLLGDNVTRDEVLDTLARVGVVPPVLTKNQQHRTDLMVEKIIKEIPMVVRVDREVWQGVDRTSRDKYVLTVRLERATMDADTLEDLADTEPFTIIRAAAWVMHHNQWTWKLNPLH